MLPGSSVGKAAGLKRLVNFRKQVRTSLELLEDQAREGTNERAIEAGLGYSPE